jgi:CheY-like chemotaxis protein
MDGLEVVGHLKADPDLAKITVVALTASAMVGDRGAFFKAGCDDYLSKPVRAGDLLAKVGEYLAPSGDMTPIVGQ